MSSTAVTPRMTHPWRRRADLAAAAAAPGSAASVAVPVTEGSGCRFSPAIRTSRLLQIPVRARFLALLGEHNAGQTCPRPLWLRPPGAGEQPADPRPVDRRADGGLPAQARGAARGPCPP